MLTTDDDWPEQHYRVQATTITTWVKLHITTTLTTREQQTTHMSPPYSSPWREPASGRTRSLLCTNMKKGEEGDNKEVICQIETIMKWKRILEHAMFLNQQ